MKKKKVGKRVSEKECVKELLRFCKILKIEPENLGIIKGVDGELHISYATTKILAGVFNTLMKANVSDFDREGIARINRGVDELKSL